MDNASLERGRIVRSKAGRDEGFLVVVRREGRYVLLADGKRRPLERPKRKNIRHVAVTARTLAEEEMQTNRSLRRRLGELNRSHGE